MIRRAFTMRLKPASLAEYKYHHDNIWPELVAEIERAGIASITTFQRDLDLFLVSEIADEAAWDKLWNSEVHQRWAEVMQPLMDLREDGIVDAGELTEVFHLSTNGEAPVSAVVVFEAPSDIMLEIYDEAAAEQAPSEPAAAPAAEPAPAAPAIQPSARPRRKIAARSPKKAAVKEGTRKKKAPAKKAKRAAKRSQGRAVKKSVKKAAKKMAGKKSSPKKAKKAAKKKMGRKKRG